MESSEEYNEIDFASLEQRILQSLEELNSKRDLVDNFRKELFSRSQSFYDLEQSLERERKEAEVCRLQFAYTSEKVNEWQLDKSAVIAREAKLQVELEVCSNERDSLLIRANQDQAKIEQMSRTIEEQQLRINTLIAFENTTRAGEAKLRPLINLLQSQIKKLEVELNRLEGHSKSASQLGVQMNILKTISEKESKDLRERVESAELKAASLEAQLAIEKEKVNGEVAQNENTYLEEWKKSRSIMSQRLNHAEENYTSASMALNQAFQTQAQLQCLVSGLQIQLNRSEKEVERLQNEIDQINENFKINNNNKENLDKECQTDYIQIT